MKGDGPYEKGKRTFDVKVMTEKEVKREKGTRFSVEGGRYEGAGNGRRENDGV